MREDWQQLIKRYTRWRRYACGQCQHRGWTRAALPRSEHPEEQELRTESFRPAGRPAESRDQRARRGYQLQVARAAVFAMLLGALLAFLIGLIGRKV